MKSVSIKMDLEYTESVLQKVKNAELLNSQQHFQELFEAHDNGLLLYLAAECTALSFTKFLFNNGVKIDQLDPFARHKGTDIISVFIQYCQFDFYLDNKKYLELLIEQKADINGNKTDRPIYTAHRTHNYYLLEILLAYGADTNIDDEKFYESLDVEDKLLMNIVNYYCTIPQHPIWDNIRDIEKCVISSNWQSDIYMYNKHLVLLLAVRCGADRIVHYILRNDNSDLVNKNNMLAPEPHSIWYKSRKLSKNDTALKLAIYHNSPQTVQLLLDLKASIKSPYFEPLVEAVKHKEIFEILLKHGMNTTMVSLNVSEQALLLTTVGGIEILKLAVKYNYFQANKPLIDSTFARSAYISVEAMKLMLPLEPDINHANGAAFECATKSSDPSCFDKLLEMKADLSKASHVLGAAAQYNNFEIVKILLATKPITKECIGRALMQENYDMVDLLVQKGATFTFDYIKDILPHCKVSVINYLKKYNISIFTENHDVQKIMARLALTQNKRPDKDLAMRLFNHDHKTEYLDIFTGAEYRKHDRTMRTIAILKYLNSPVAKIDLYTC